MAKLKEIQVIKYLILCAIVSTRSLSAMEENPAPYGAKTRLEDLQDKARKAAVRLQPYDLSEWKDPSQYRWYLINPSGDQVCIGNEKKPPVLTQNENDKLKEGWELYCKILQ